MKFGTSGLRGLVPDLLGPGTAKYATAFGRHLVTTNQVSRGSRIYIGGDLRHSTPQIMAICMGALEELGFIAVDCGFLPTPALALHAMTHQAACLMVTGSHIPADRNGIKFYTPGGEITKADEVAITRLAREIDDATIGIALAKRVQVETEADALFLSRNKVMLPSQLLQHLRIGVYQHSTVARDALVSVLNSYGAEVIPLGRSSEFVPVDTEAVPDTLVNLLSHWAETHRLDAIVSADGDGDRPLVTDETGMPVRGDVLGLLVARFLGAKVIATPVTSSSGVESSGSYVVHRTKVGSPYVIEAMAQSLEKGDTSIMGFEANGGVLTASTFDLEGRLIVPLPTRDSFLPILATLSFVATQKRRLSHVVGSLRLPIALSGRLQDYPFDKSAELMAYLRANRENLQAFLKPLGQVVSSSDIDGLRVALEDGSIVHMRPSGNAPEMRCYVEAMVPKDAAWLLQRALHLLNRMAVAE